MGRDEEEAVGFLNETMRDKDVDQAVRVNAATGLLLWSTLESIAKQFDPKRLDSERL